MKKLVTFLLVTVFILALSLSGCKKPNEGPAPKPMTDSFFGDQYSTSNEDFYSDFSQEEKSLYYRLWDEDVKISLYVDISPYELYKIDEAFDDYRNGNTLKADTYRKCNLKITVDGEEYFYEEVGVRMRGNTSRREFCREDGQIFDLVHFRFSLTETFRKAMRS